VIDSRNPIHALRGATRPMMGPVMRKSHTFTPAVSETLEARSVPSAVLSTVHAVAVLPHAVVTTPPVIHPAGTFSNGSVPTIEVAADGERFTLRGGIAVASPVKTVTVKPAAVVATATVKPAAVAAAPVVTPPVVVHPAGTFSNGTTPTILVATDGERFMLR